MIETKNWISNFFLEWGIKVRKRWRRFLTGAMTVLFAMGFACGAEVLAADPSVILPTGDSAERIPPDKLKKITAAAAAEMNASMKAYVPSEDTLIHNNAQTYYYYEQLDPTAKEIYDVMLMIAKDPVTQDNLGVMMTDMDPGSEEYYYEMLCAYYAMTYDHPELFWLYCGTETTISFYSELMNMNGIYLVYYGLSEPYAKYETQMTAFNQAAEEFLKDIDKTASDYEIAKQIHDKLIDLVTYDNHVLENMDTQGQNLAHTAYGALVANTEGSSNYAVCDGYALAYEYLLQQCGIEAVVIGGDAGSDEFSTGGHAWNLVKLDGVWYEADPTWDDAGTIEAGLSSDVEGYSYYCEALNDQEYREKLQHYMFLLSTENLRNYVPDDSFTYNSKDGRYWVRLVGESVHIRWDNSGLPEPRNADPTVLSLAPVAAANYQKF